MIGASKNFIEAIFMQLKLLYTMRCVFVEIILNAMNALTWDYAWWSAKMPILIILFGYLPFFLMSYWVFDMATIKKKVTTVGIIYGVDILAVLIFGVGLKWI